jgi:hypothetical protein
VKRVLRDSLPDGVPGWCTRLEQPVRDDHPPRQPAAQVHPPERNITRLIAKNLHTGVAGSGQVYWLVARHASDRKASGPAGPSGFLSRGGDA